MSAVACGATNTAIKIMSTAKVQQIGYELVLQPSLPVIEGAALPRWDLEVSVLHLVAS